MRIILHFLFILAVFVLLENVYCDSSGPLPNASPNFQVLATNIQLDEDLHRPPAPRPHAPRPRAPSPPPQVTSYILAAQWPPGVCTGKDVTCQIKPMPTEFTIHGLWPQPNGEPSKETFDDQKISTLTSELNKNWPNLESAQQSASVFWQKEWNTHGMYSGLGVHDYFDKSLQLLEVKLREKLAAQKIIPSIFQTYKLKDIQAAVKKINGGFSGSIKCVQRQGGSKNQQIQEIQFKYTKDFKKQDNKDSSNCNPEILFPVPLYVTSYILAVQWPPGVCTGKSGVTCRYKPKQPEFTIHGLWPQPDDAPSTETFDAQKLSTLTTELNKDWPNLESEQQSVSINLKFWTAEWIKHGKYSGLGLREYFEKSLQLLEAKLREKLATEKIIPHISKIYKLADIQAAVEKINGGFSATIRCVERQGSSKTQQIQEIRFMYTNDFQKKKNTNPTNCGPEIMFPTSVSTRLTEVVSMPEIHHHPL